jgi:hypothetical protein
MLATRAQALRPNLGTAMQGPPIEPYLADAPEFLRKQLKTAFDNEGGWFAIERLAARGQGGGDFAAAAVVRLRDHAASERRQQDTLWVAVVGAATGVASLIVSVLTALRSP